MRIDTILVEVDNIFDYFPFVSSATSLFTLCAKNFLSENSHLNHFWRHVKDKDPNRCYTLLLPALGNIHIMRNDYFQYQDSLPQQFEKLKKKAEELKDLASLTSGQKVTTEQMMPALDAQKMLAEACEKNDQFTLKKLLKKGISPNFYHWGKTPLTLACEVQNISIVKLLLENGADARTADLYGDAPIKIACNNGNLRIVQMLFPHIQDIDTPDRYGMTPLMYTVLRKHKWVARFLIGKGANPYATNAKGFDAFEVACSISQKYGNLISLLFEEGKEKDLRRYMFLQTDLLIPIAIHNLTPFLYAALLGNEEIALTLLPDSDVRKSDSDNRTALFYAVDHLPLLKAILAKCSDPAFINQRDNSGKTAYEHALSLGQYEAARLLSDKPFVEKKPARPNTFFSPVRDEVFLTLYHSGLKKDQMLLKKEDPEPRSAMEILADAYRAIE